MSAAQLPNTDSGLAVYQYGPDDGPTVLALHGLSGHGERWAGFSSEYAPEFRIVAPSLRGHGYSTWEPPYSWDAQTDSVLEAIDRYAPAPILVGHSWGGALAIRLARRLRNQGREVSGLLLLDPAQGMHGPDAQEFAESQCTDFFYTDGDEARNEKLHGGWSDVPLAELDREVRLHLTTQDGRVAWRISQACQVTMAGELAGKPVAPPADVRTIVLRATRVQPPFVTDEFVELIEPLELAELRDVDCGHMIPFARPQIVADALRELANKA